MYEAELRRDSRFHFGWSNRRKLRGRPWRRKSAWVERAKARGVTGMLTPRQGRC